MSENEIVAQPDRRARRSRAAILAAFVRLLGERRWEAIRIEDIAEAADVARSTFYQHFASKEALLLASMEPMLEVLTNASNPTQRDRLDQLMLHYWSNRPLARAIFCGPRASVIERALRDRLAPGGSGNDQIIAATRISAARMALIAAWVRGDFSASAPKLADAVASCD